MTDVEWKAENALDTVHVRTLLFSYLEKTITSGTGARLGDTSAMITTVEVPGAFLIPAMSSDSSPHCQPRSRRIWIATRGRRVICPSINDWASLLLNWP